MKRKKQDSHSPNPVTPEICYPAFLNLKDKKAVVVGGGKIAERKIIALLKTGADIKVISPELTKKIEKEKLQGRIEHICRRYRKGDLKNAFLVIAATNSPAANELISKDAPCLVNVVDTPHLCNFIVPSTVTRGPLCIAISTSGISPALSMSIRKELEKLYGPGFSNYLKLLKKIRSQAMAHILNGKQRRNFLQAIASEKIAKMLREKGLKKTKKVADNLFRKAKSP